MPKRPSADDMLDGPPVQGPGFAQVQQPAAPVAPVPPATPTYTPRDRPKTFRFDLEFLEELAAYCQRTGRPQNQVLQAGARREMADEKGAQ